MFKLWAYSTRLIRFATIFRWIYICNCIGQFRITLYNISTNIRQSKTLNVILKYLHFSNYTDQKIYLAPISCLVLKVKIMTRQHMRQGMDLKYKYYLHYDRFAFQLCYSWNTWCHIKCKWYIRTNVSLLSEF